MPNHKAYETLAYVSLVFRHLMTHKLPCYGYLAFLFSVWKRIETRVGRIHSLHCKQFGFLIQKHIYTQIKFNFKPRTRGTCQSQVNLLTHHRYHKAGSCGVQFVFRYEKPNAIESSAKHTSIIIVNNLDCSAQKCQTCTKLLKNKWNAGVCCSAFYFTHIPHVLCPINHVCFGDNSIDALNIFMQQATKSACNTF